MSDLLDELKEDLHEEQLQQFWKKYGNWVIGGVIAILGGTACGVAWQSWSTSKQSEYATAYASAISIEADRLDESVKILEDLSQKSTGFSFLAKFHMASKALRGGDKPQALKHLHAVTQMGHLDPVYRDLATLMSLYIDKDANVDAALKTLDRISGENNPWRYLALELKGLFLMKKKEFALAQATFEGLVAANLPVQAFHHRVKALAQWAKESATQSKKS